MNNQMLIRTISLVVLLAVVAGCSTNLTTPLPTALVTGNSQILPSPVGEQTITPPLVVVISPTPITTVPALQPTPGPDFCADARVQALLAAFSAALINQDGAALAETIDPVDGLDIFYRLANPLVHISPVEADALFTSTFAYTWGDQAGSGLPVEGTFSAEILPHLLDVFERPNTQACQDLAFGSGTGPTTAVVEWPAQFAGLPFIAVYRAAGAQDNELDWRTWAVGFTVVNGAPKIRVLVQYIWEI
ncbi:MAG: hypothetical protein ACYDHA_06500 [Bellilinea sp.]